MSSSSPLVAEIGTTAPVPDLELDSKKTKMIYYLFTVIMNTGVFYSTAITDAILRIEGFLRATIKLSTLTLA